ncbi:hypothetical protein ScPMuIL_008062 [Solemya velum]
MPVTRIFKTEKELQDAIRAEELKHTVRFVKQWRRQIASNEEGLSPDGKRVRFEDEGHPSPVINIPYEGTPFIIINNEVYECQHGPQRMKGEKKDVLTSKTTKKLNCPAMIRIRRIMKFPEYKINGPSTKKAKMALSSTLKRSLSDTTIRQLVIYATIASNEEHKNHAIGENAGYCQPLYGDIIRKIKELAEEGHRKVTSVKLLLAQYVREHLAPDIPETNRRFYPTSKDIRNHIYHTVVGGRLVINLKAHYWSKGLMA